MNRKLLLSYFIALTLVLIFAPTSAFTGSRLVEGMVVAPDGEPIKGFPIIFESGSDNRVTITDIEGKYIIKLPPGNYDIVPANEPDKATEIEVKNKSWFNWKQDSTLDAGKIVIETGKRY